MRAEIAVPNTANSTMEPRFWKKLPCMIECQWSKRAGLRDEPCQQNRAIQLPAMDSWGLTHLMEGVARFEDDGREKKKEERLRSEILYVLYK